MATQAEVKTDKAQEHAYQMLTAEARSLDNAGHYRAASKVRGLANGVAALSAENLALREALDAILELDADEASFGMVRAQQIASAALLNATKKRMGQPPAAMHRRLGKAPEGWVG